MSKYFQKKSESNDSISSNSSNITVAKTLEQRLLEVLKKYFNYDGFKSETQRLACLEISKRQSDVYVINSSNIFKTIISNDILKVN